MLPGDTSEASLPVTVDMRGVSPLLGKGLQEALPCEKLTQAEVLGQP